MFRHVPTHPARSHQPLPNLLTQLQQLQDGAPVRARVNRWVRCLRLKKLWFMVDIGRYNELVNGDYNGL